MTKNHEQKKLENNDLSQREQDSPSVIDGVPPLADLGDNLANASLLGITLHRILSPLQGIAKNVTHGLHIAGLAFRGLDFLYVPARYLASWIRHKENPMTLSKNVRWLYAGVVLGLSLTAAFLPVTVPAISLVLGIVGLGSTAIALANFYHRRTQNRDDLEKAQQELALQQKCLTKLKAEQEAHLKTQDLTKDNKEWEEENAILTECVADSTKKIQRLTQKVTQLKQNQGKYSESHQWDRIAGVGLSSLGLIGMTLIFIFPPVGIGMLATTASLGCAYIVVRAVLAGIMGIKKRLNAQTPSTSIQKQQALDESNEGPSSSMAQVTKTLLENPTDNLPNELLSREESNAQPAANDNLHAPISPISESESLSLGRP